MWWEYFRLRDLPEDELLDERAAVARPRVRRAKSERVKKSVVLRFSYPAAGARAPARETS